MCTVPTRCIKLYSLLETQSLLKVYPKSTENLPKVCSKSLKFTQSPLKSTKVSSKYVQSQPKFCPSFVQKVFKNFAISLPKVCKKSFKSLLKVIESLPKVCQKSAKVCSKFPKSTKVLCKGYQKPLFEKHEI